MLEPRRYIPAVLCVEVCGYVYKGDMYTSKLGAVRTQGGCHPRDVALLVRA